MNSCFRKSNLYFKHLYDIHSDSVNFILIQVIFNCGEQLKKKIQNPIYLLADFAEHKGRRCINASKNLTRSIWNFCSKIQFLLSSYLHLYRSTTAYIKKPVVENVTFRNKWNLVMHIFAHSLNNKCNWIFCEPLARKKGVSPAVGIFSPAPGNF